MWEREDAPESLFPGLSTFRYSRALRLKTMNRIGTRRTNPIQNEPLNSSISLW